ncbi:MAG: hypothetical protein QXU32_03465 [Nitrososphaerales archaeon]
MNLHFVYVSRSDEHQQRMKDDWLYVYEMAKFYRWWLHEKLDLYYTISTDVLLVVKTHFMRFRFGMSDLMKHHREKGEDDYHFYLSYFKPLLSDCSAGFFADNVGLIRWKTYAGDIEKNKFFALENCTKVSHVLLHEAGRQKHYDNKKFKEEIHEQWDRHIYKMDEFEFYDRNFRNVTKDDDFMFATMKIPEHKN